MFWLEVFYFVINGCFQIILLSGGLSIVLWGKAGGQHCME